MSKEPGLVFLDVGKIKQRALKDLEQGRGRLMDEVERAVREAAAGLETDEVLEFVPVVIVFGRKRKRRKRKKGLLGGA